MDRLIIIGASGHGKVVADIALKSNKYSEICFLDDNSDTKECIGFPVIGKSSEYEKLVSNSEFFVAIGNNHVREKILEKLLENNAKIATLIHPNACMGHHVKIGIGSVVMAGAIINPETVIGKGVIVNTACSIDHDNIIEDYCHISVGAHLAGTVHVGKHTWIGAGVTIINSITICNECMIGAGAVVVNDICKKGIYIGIPAKIHDDR